MEILILCGIYLAELVCYQLVFWTLFEVKLRIKIFAVLGILLPVIITYLPVNDASGKNFIITVGIIVIMFVSVEGTMIEKGIWLVLIFLLLECIEGILLKTCEQIVSFIIKNNYIINANYLVIKCCTALIISLAYLIKGKSTFNKIHINSAIYLIIGVIAISMTFCSAFLNQVTFYLPDRRFIFFCSILNIAILISIILLVVFVIYIKNNHERMEQLLKTEQLLKESQVNYYKQILKKEADTRKYRHDMINHLIYVQDILSMNRLNDAQKYLASILGGFRKIQNTYLIIGNEMIETIMNYFFGMLPKNVEIQVKDRCPVDIDMDDTDICTVFSNLFQNIVEEIIENDIINAKIIIKVQKGMQYVKYNIKNSTMTEISKKCIDKNGLPKSHKADKRNHGIGLINVKETVERNNGKFEWYQINGYFCVDIILPIK